MSIRSYRKPGSSRLRRGWFSETGHVYLVTFTTANRKKAFAHRLAAIEAVKALRAASIECRSELYCWVLMPDHWHGLVRLGDGIKLSELVHRVKGPLVSRSEFDVGRVWSDMGSRVSRPCVAR
jgi:REP element-mobilizing transposase RayT